MNELLQHAIVTITAFGCAAVIVRRAFGAVAGSPAQPKCNGCPSATSAASSCSPAPVAAQPLTFVKR